MARRPNQPEPEDTKASTRRGLALVLIVLFMVITIAAFGFAIFLLTQATSSNEAQQGLVRSLLF